MRTSISARFRETFLPKKNIYFEPSRDGFTNPSWRPLFGRGYFLIFPSVLIFVDFFKKKICALLSDFFIFDFLIFSFDSVFFEFVFGSSHSGKSQVTRVTVGRDTNQPTKVFEFVKLILRPLKSRSMESLVGSCTVSRLPHPQRL